MSMQLARSLRLIVAVAQQQIKPMSDRRCIDPRRKQLSLTGKSF
jgi:hypothetical protein